MRDKFPVPPAVEREILNILSEIDFYWTPPEKQQFLAHIIARHGLKNAVEIGVYTGGSFIPQVVAVTANGGFATGIDPYSQIAATQTDNRELLDKVNPALLNPDRDKMYKDLVELLDRRRLSDSCRILRMTSNEAVAEVEETIDILHIDGNHDYDMVLADLRNYLPKLRVGGFLVMDDINWGTIEPLYRATRDQMESVYETEIWACCRKTSTDIALPGAGTQRPDA